jgi:hypothetical protein
MLMQDLNEQHDLMHTADRGSGVHITKHTAHAQQLAHDSYTYNQTAIITR